MILGFILTAAIWDYIKPGLVDNADTSTKPDSTNQKSLNDLTNDKELNSSLEKMSTDELIALVNKNEPVYKPPSIVSGLAQDVIVFENKIKQKSRDLFNNKNQTPKPLSKQDTNKKHSDIVDPSRPPLKLVGIPVVPMTQRPPIVDIFDKQVSTEAGKSPDDNKTQTSSKLPVTEKTIGDTKTRTDTELGGSYFKQGNDKYDLRDFAGAIQDYSKAIELNPKDAVAYHRRGVVKGHSLDYAGAIGDCNKAIEINPKCAEAYGIRGIAKADSGNITGAIEDCNKAIELDPKCAEAYNSRAVVKRMDVG